MDFLTDEIFDTRPKIICKSLNGHDEWVALKNSKCDAHVDLYYESGIATYRFNELYLYKGERDGSSKEPGKV